MRLNRKVNQGGKEFKLRKIQNNSNLIKIKANIKTYSNGKKLTSKISKTIKSNSRISRSKILAKSFKTSTPNFIKLRTKNNNKLTLNLKYLKTKMIFQLIITITLKCGWINTTLIMLSNLNFFMRMEKVIKIIAERVKSKETIAETKISKEHK